MVHMVNSKEVKSEYKKPNRDILTIHYWVRKINEHLLKK